VAEPWWNNAAVNGLVEQGLIPLFDHLTVYFPERKVITIDPATIRLSTEGVDLAVLFVPPDAVNGVPVLPLFSGNARELRGSRIILLGYPTGINAVLARTEPDVASEIFSSVSNTAGLLAALAERSLIVPVVTQGALNEVRDRRLVYDAETTSGGSGGPVFGPDGKVIGVNFAITRDFDGSNFGVPIRYASQLLEGVQLAP
jgi:S1-C subfamily serine protease